MLETTAGMTAVVGCFAHSVYVAVLHTYCGFSFLNVGVSPLIPGLLRRLPNGTKNQNDNNTLVKIIHTEYYSLRKSDRCNRERATLLLLTRFVFITS